ncbi:hypothetical protein Tco_0450938 [Tanacetum coccineum]
MSVSRLSRTKKLAHGMDYMEIKEAVNEGRQSNKTEELNLDVDTEVIAKDKGSSEKGGSTMKEEKPRKKEWHLNMFEDSSRHDKEKNQGVDQIERDEELSHKLHEEELAEIARIQEEKSTQEEASRVAIMEMFDEVQAGIDVDALFAAKLQQEDREEYRIEERAKFLAETIVAQRKFKAAQRAAEIRNAEKEFSDVSKEEKRRSKNNRMSKRKRQNRSKESYYRIFRSDGSSNGLRPFIEKNENSGRSRKMEILRARNYLMRILGFHTMTLEDGLISLCQKLYGSQLTMLHSKELAGPKQTALGKDFSNPLIVDSLLKTIWLLMHHVVTMKHWLFQSNDSGKETSNSVIGPGVGLPKKYKANLDGVC